MSGWEESSNDESFKDKDNFTFEGSLNAKQQSMQRLRQLNPVISKSDPANADTDSTTLRSPMREKASQDLSDPPIESSIELNPSSHDEEDSEEQAVKLIFSKAANIIRESIEVGKSERKFKRLIFL